MSERTILAVAFDFDGLMFNTEDLWDIVGETILQRRGHTTRPEVVARMMGRQSQDALAIMIAAYGLDASVKDLEDESEEIFLNGVDQAQPMPGFLPLLEALITADIPRAITTSSRPQLIQPILERNNLLDKFVFRLTSVDIENSKPAPEIYLTAATRFGVPPERMLVLEDSEIGCEAAVAADAFTIAVPSQSKLQLAFPGVKLIVDRLDDPRVYAALELAV